MSQFNDYEVTEMMIRYGGGFVSKLGELFRQADESNKRRLKTAFPDYWAKYVDLLLQKAGGKGDAHAS